MNKPLKTLLIVHFALIAAAWLIVAGSLVFFLTKWDSLPERAGIHFAADGNFDVYADKGYGFYPHIIGTVLIAGAAFAGAVAAKKKTGLNITEKGERLFKTELCLTVDIIAILIGLWAMTWTVSVSTQTPLDPGLMGAIITAMLGAGAVGIAAEIITARVCRADKKSSGKDAKRAALEHRLHRLVPWMLAAAELLVTVLIWERLPDEDPTGFYHLNGLAYFADFDAYLSKWLLLVPVAAIAAILTVLELIGHKIEKSDKTALIVFTDRLKLINALFFFIADIQILSENPVGLPVILLYAGTTAASAAAFAVKHKTSSGGNL